MDGSSMVCLAEHIEDNLCFGSVRLVCFAQHLLYFECILVRLEMCAPYSLPIGLIGYRNHFL